jgi:2-amino-4-hydroxy-6-hydroxymethyldihydropteridine diphosphokinase
MKRIFLSLGSNLGDRIVQLQRALSLLSENGIHIERTSSFYKTEPVDFLPQAWFLNLAAEALTNLLPVQLLHACQRIERQVGRRPGVRKGPRSIDVDILFYESAVIRTSELTIPHPAIAERRFVLIPLAEIAPGARHPVTQQTVLDLLHETTDHSQVVRWHPEAAGTAGATKQEKSQALK